MVRPPQRKLDQIEEALWIWVGPEYPPPPPLNENLARLRSRVPPPQWKGGVQTNHCIPHRYRFAFTAQAAFSTTLSKSTLVSTIHFWFMKCPQVSNSTQTTLRAAEISITTLSSHFWWLMQLLYWFKARDHFTGCEIQPMRLKLMRGQSFPMLSSI